MTQEILLRLTPDPISAPQPPPPFSSVLIWIMTADPLCLPSSPIICFPYSSHNDLLKIISQTWSLCSKATNIFPSHLATFPSSPPSIFAQCSFSKVFLDYLKQHSSPNLSTPYIPFLQNTSYHLTSGMSLCQYCFPAESPVSRRMPGKYGTPAIPVCGMHG